MADVSSAVENVDEIRKKNYFGEEGTLKDSVYSSGILMTFFLEKKKQK